MSHQPAADPLAWVATAPWPCAPLGRLTARVFPGLCTGERGRARPAERAGEEAAERLLTLADVSDAGLPPREALGPAPALAPGRLERYRLAAGDLVLPSRGTRLRVALVPEQTAGAVAGANLLVIRPGPALRPAVLLTALRGEACAQVLRQLSRAAAPRLSLRAADLAALPVPVPPAQVQDEIAALLALAEHHHQLALRAATLRLQAAESLAQALLGEGAAQRPPAGPA